MAWKNGHCIDKPCPVCQCVNFEFATEKTDFAIIQNIPLKDDMLEYCVICKKCKVVRYIDSSYVITGFLKKSKKE